MARKTKRNPITASGRLADVNPLNIKLAKEFARYMRSMMRSEETIRGYMNDLKIFFLYLLEECDNKSIIDCTVRDFVNFQGYLLGDLEHSPARVRRLKSTISSFSNAIELLYPDKYPNFRNLIKKVENPVNKPTREKTILSQTQITHLLNTFVLRRQFEKACCFALAAYSGRRKSELFRFKVSDFDDDKIVYGTFYKSDPILTKGRSGGKKICCYTLVKQFKPYLDYWLEERKRRGIESEWLFPNPDDPTRSRSAHVMDSWSRSATKILGVDVYPHAFRHAMVSYLARAGLPNNVIVSLMQWEKSSGDSMVAIYNDADDDEELGKYFSNGDILTKKKTRIEDL